MVAVSLGPTELLIVLGIVLLLVGSTQLPKLARSMGQASREFQHGVDPDRDADTTHTPTP